MGRAALFSKRLCNFGSYVKNMQGVTSTTQGLRHAAAHGAQADQADNDVTHFLGVLEGSIGIRPDDAGTVDARGCAGEVDHAVDDKRRRLESATGRDRVGLERPLRGQPGAGRRGGPGLAGVRFGAGPGFGLALGFQDAVGGALGLGRGGDAGRGERCGGVDRAVRRARMLPRGSPAIRRVPAGLPRRNRPAALAA